MGKQQTADPTSTQTVVPRQGNGTPETTSPRRAARANDTSGGVSRGKLLLAAGSVLLLAVAGVLAYVLAPHGSVSTVNGRVKDTRSLSLPDSVAGVAKADDAVDFGTKKVWIERETQAAGGSTVAGAQYGTPSKGRVYRLIVARTDMGTFQEFGWPADQGVAVDGGRCTQNLHIGSTAARVRPTMMVCWTTSSSQSALAMVIDLKNPVKTADGETALKAALSAFGS